MPKTKIKKSMPQLRRKKGDSTEERDAVALSPEAIEATNYKARGRLDSFTSARPIAKTAHKPLDLAGAINEMRSTEKNDNMKRFLRMRELKKSYWTAGKHTRFWLTNEGVAERRVEGVNMVPAKIDYEHEGQVCGTSWKTATVAEVESMLAMGKKLTLHNC